MIQRSALLSLLLISFITGQSLSIDTEDKAPIPILPIAPSLELNNIPNPIINNNQPASSFNQNMDPSNLPNQQGINNNIQSNTSNQDNNIQPNVSMQDINNKAQDANNKSSVPPIENNVNKINNLPIQNINSNNQPIAPTENNSNAIAIPPNQNNVNNETNIPPIGINKNNVPITNENNAVQVNLPKNNNEEDKEEVNKSTTEINKNTIPINNTPPMTPQVDNSSNNTSTSKNQIKPSVSTININIQPTPISNGESNLEVQEVDEDTLNQTATKVVNTANLNSLPKPPKQNDVVQNQNIEKKDVLDDNSKLQVNNQMKTQLANNEAKAQQAIVEKQNKIMEDIKLKEQEENEEEEDDNQFVNILNLNINSEDLNQAKMNKNTIPDFMPMPPLENPRLLPQERFRNLPSPNVDSTMLLPPNPPLDNSKLLPSSPQMDNTRLLPPLDNPRFLPLDDPRLITLTDNSKPLAPSNNPKLPSSTFENSIKEIPNAPKPPILINKLPTPRMDSEQLTPLEDLDLLNTNVIAISNIINSKLESSDVNNQQLNLNDIKINNNQLSNVVIPSALNTHSILNELIKLNNNQQTMIMEDSTKLQSSSSTMINNASPTQCKMDTYTTTYASTSTYTSTYTYTVSETETTTLTKVEFATSTVFKIIPTTVFINSQVNTIPSANVKSTKILLFLEKPSIAA